MSPKTTLRFIGTASAVPEAGRDTACLLLNDTCLIDTGWCAALHMLSYGCDPMAVDTLLLTHCHHDHYLGLPQLLFYHGMNRRRLPEKPPLLIVGPKPDVGRVVERALSFLRHQEFRSVATVPEVHALQAGERYETSRLTITTAPTVHPVIGLCYRIEDHATDAVIGVTGDTAYHEPLAAHVAWADLLVHEASRGPVSSEPNALGGHSGSVDAARIALAAKVKRLALVHYASSQRDESLAAAREVFSETIMPAAGDCLEWDG